MTDLPVPLVVALVAIGLPRTILADLDVVAPGSSLLYYVLALAPFAAWLAVAVGRRTARPVADFLVVGALYGLSLVAVHQVLWDVAISSGHPPPAAAYRFADLFSPALHELAVRGYTVIIAMAIGLGCGLVAALVAKAAGAWSDRRPARLDAAR